MNDIFKKIEINLDYSYLLIARQSVLNEPYSNIKKTLLNDFGNIK